MKKRFLLLLLCAMLFLTLLPTPLSPIALAAGETLISNRAELESITGTGSYRLTADIDLAGKSWTPLPAFSGTLDGGDHIIRNLSITDTTATSGNNKGLFASIAGGGQVTNLGMEGVNITAGNYSGGIAGTSSGTISRCYTTGTVNGEQYAGGLVGVNSGAIENCYSRVSASGKDFLGGLAGSNSGTITKSYAASTVTDSVMNNYLQFNSGGYVSIPHKDIYKTDNFTLEAWFQWGSAETANIEFIFGKGFEKFEIHTGGDSGKNGLRFIPVPQGHTKTTPEGYNGDSYIDVHNVLQAGWFHVAAVYSYNNATQTASVQVYVNGEAQDLWQKPTASDAPENKGKTATIARSTNPLKAASNNEAINIGRRNHATDRYFFNGKIADVRFWNTARTGDEIKANKDKVLTGGERGLLGYWKLNESTGGAIDSSSTNNNGTLNSVSPGSVTRVTSTGAAANKGALTGFGTATGCFYDSELYGTSAGGAGTAATTANMKNQSTYTGWDFDATWKIAGSDYPNLGFKTVTAVTVSPAPASVVKGRTQGFSASVTGANSPAGTVTWRVDGNASEATTISQDGILAVAPDETATALTVTATSTVDTTKSGTASVTIMLPPTLYKITAGQNGEWAKGSVAGLRFTADAEYTKFFNVSVDNATISGTNYTVESGSTIVTLKPEYLSTLSVGRHTLRINFTDGYAETNFTITAAGVPGAGDSPDIPKTGDTAQPWLWLEIALLACAGLVTSLAVRRRRQSGKDKCDE